MKAPEFLLPLNGFSRYKYDPIRKTVWSFCRKDPIPLQWFQWCKIGERPDVCVTPVNDLGEKVVLTRKTVIGYVETRVMASGIKIHDQVVIQRDLGQIFGVDIPNCDYYWDSHLSYLSRHRAVCTVLRINRLHSTTSGHHVMRSTVEISDPKGTTWIVPGSCLSKAANDKVETTQSSEKFLIVDGDCSTIVEAEDVDAAVEQYLGNIGSDGFTDSDLLAVIPMSHITEYQVKTATTIKADRV